jgi:folate-binding protein YgfZ
MPSITHQYRTIVAGAGWTDRSGRGRIAFRGGDAAPFLQALVTNDLRALVRGHGVYAAYLTPQGRMIADMRVYHRGDALIADVPPGAGAPLAERFDQLIFGEDVRVADVTHEVGQTAVAGGRAAEVVGTALGLEPAALSGLAMWSQLDAAGGAFVARTEDASLPSFDVFGPADAQAAVRRALEGAGAVAMTTGLVEALRVDAGRPVFGVDMTEETIPLEAGLLDRAISTDKGCYVGQEVIIRVLHRGGGRVAKRLVKLAFDAGVADAPAAGDPLAADGRNVGKLTSVARALDDSGWIALGYVHRDTAEAGRRVTLADRPDAEATVTGFGG